MPIAVLKRTTRSVRDDEAGLREMGEGGDGGGALEGGPDAGLLGEQLLGGEDLVIGHRDGGAAALAEGAKHEVVTDA